jgi:alkanesulfonate monooxygenase SsuD/methylene tetrahydromethanopterin reductase-like flavin-dependent oxidoreductase (luciferase family)
VPAFDAAMDVRFGLTVSVAADGSNDPVAQAREAEALGFDLITVSDHLHGSYPTFETWTALTWIAASTSTIRVAPMVLGLFYRPPVVVAKMAESLDRLSGGRLVLGMGGGGSDDEAAAFGLAVRSPGEKVAALEEALTIVRGVWRTSPFTFHGRHFHVDEAMVEPKPSHRIPIWLGTYGPRALDVTGRVADGWNPSYAYAPPDVLIGMRDGVLRAAEAAGRDPSELEWSYNVAVQVRDGVAQHPRMVNGSAEQVVEKLAAIVRMGMTTLVFWPRGRDEQLGRLTNDVLPALRDAVR